MDNITSEVAISNGMVVFRFAANYIDESFAAKADRERMAGIEDARRRSYGRAVEQFMGSEPYRRLASIRGRLAEANDRLGQAEQKHADGEQSLRLCVEGDGDLAAARKGRDAAAGEMTRARNWRDELLVMKQGTEKECQAALDAAIKQAHTGLMAAVRARRDELHRRMADAMREFVPLLAIERDLGTTFFDHVKREFGQLPTGPAIEPAKPAAIKQAPPPEGVVSLSKFSTY